MRPRTQEQFYECVCVHPCVCKHLMQRSLPGNVTLLHCYLPNRAIYTAEYLINLHSNFWIEINHRKENRKCEGVNVDPKMSQSPYDVTPTAKCKKYTRTVFKGGWNVMQTTARYSHGLIILKLQLACSHFVVLPSLSGSIQGSIGNGDQASSPRRPEHLHLHHANTFTHPLSGTFKCKDA